MALHASSGREKAIIPGHIEEQLYQKSSSLFQRNFTDRGPAEIIFEHR